MRRDAAPPAPLAAPDTLFTAGAGSAGAVAADGCVLQELRSLRQPAADAAPSERRRILKQGQLDWFISVPLPSFVITVIFLCRYGERLPHRLMDNTSLSAPAPGLIESLWCKLTEFIKGWGSRERWSAAFTACQFYECHKYVSWSSPCGAIVLLYFPPTLSSNRSHNETHSNQFSQRMMEERDTFLFFLIKSKWLLEKQASLGSDTVIMLSNSESFQHDFSSLSGSTFISC